MQELTEWREARAAFLALPSGSPDTRSALDRLANAEGALFNARPPALRSTPSSGEGVSVKPLEWKPAAGGDEISRCEVGIYAVGSVPDGIAGYFRAAHDDLSEVRIYDGQDRVEAKAVAETHRANIVLSALSQQPVSSPAGEPVARAEVQKAYDILCSGKPPHSAREANARRALRHALEAAPASPVMEDVTVTEEMVERGLVYYSEGGCSGLSTFERREVVQAIIEAALSPQEQKGGA